MRILVTGLRGFTGHYVQAELEQHGHEVLGLSHDILDRAAIADEISKIQPESVIHLAAVSFFAHPNPIDFYRVNVLGTYHLLEALTQYAPALRGVLLVSSAKVYQSGQEIVTEKSLLNPESDYAVSKLAMEQMAQLWMDRLPIFMVRPFNYTGVGQSNDFVIPKIVQHFKNKAETIELGNIEVWREFGDVRTVAEIYRRLLECAPVGRTVNVSTNMAHSLREVLEMATEITGHSLEVKVNPTYVRPHETPILKGENSQLKEIIGDWATSSLQETLQWMLLSSL
ncbi:MAG: GDP-mannose 4,6-dehydratase [Legionellaceae bacterium]|nr:GDP-mannose 4,6-dehydratase [Legionellaceae bacterium]